MSNDINVRIQLQDEASKQMADVAKKIDKELKHVSTSVTETSNKTSQAVTNSNNELGQEATKTYKKMGAGFNRSLLGMKTLSSSIIRGDLTGAVQGFGAVARGAFSAASVAAVAATVGISAAVAGVGLLVTKIATMVGESKKEIAALQTKAQELTEVRISLMRDGREKEEKEAEIEYAKMLDRLGTKETLLEIKALEKKWKIVDGRSRVAPSPESIAAEQRARSLREQYNKDTELAEDAHKRKMIEIEEKYTWDIDLENKKRVELQSQSDEAEIDAIVESYKSKTMIEGEMQEVLWNQRKEFSKKQYALQKQEESESENMINAKANIYTREAQIDKQRNDRLLQQMALEAMIMDQRNAMIMNFIGSLARLNEEEKGSAIITKGLYMGQAIMNTALGVTKAISSPATIPLVPWIIGTGAVQLAQIASQKFAQGGVVRGESRTGDNVLVRANAGEMVLTEQQQLKLYKMATGEGSGGTAINLHITTDNNNIDQTALKKGIIQFFSSGRYKEATQMLDVMARAGSR
jgi:hypothetical protein